MFAQRNFVACIEGQLAERGFGAKRKAEILDTFEGLTARFKSQGYGEQIAQSMAMNKVFDALALRTRDRAKGALKSLEVQATSKARVDLIDTMATTGKLASWFAARLDGGKGKGAAIARIAITSISPDPRFPGISAEGFREAYRGKYWALLADSIEKFGKGAFGRQKGNSGLYDIAREIYAPGSTKNADAATFAKALDELDTVMVNDRNIAGGNLQKLQGYLPQRANTAAVLKAGYDGWKAVQRWDWDRMGWPNGEPIATADREGVMRAVYDTLATNGKNKLDPTSFGGRGSSIGDELDNHRFIHYADADAWIANHEAFGGGANVFDVISSHIEHMAHKSSLIQMFGRNPKMGYENWKATVLKKAASLTKEDKQAVTQAQRVIDNRFKPMFDQYSHANPMDGDSVFAATVVTTSNLLASAQLNSAVMLALPGDFAQTLAVRYANNMPLLSGIDTYLKGVTADYKSLQSRMARAGFVFDNAVGATYTTERFSPVATHGPQFSRVLSDGMMRASLMNRHTEIARGTAQHEMMGLLQDHIKEAYDDLPFSHVLARYGIGKDEWDAARKAIVPWTPEPGAEFFRPLDLLDTKLPNAHDLYTKFYTFMNQESKYMVPGATLEANVTLTGNKRPDTMVGAMLHSFKMYKNFPVTFAQMYGRMALAQERTIDKLGFAAAIMAGAGIVGAVGTQMRELIKGRTPLPMNTATFWGKAFMAGGGASIYGDFLFSGVGDVSRGISAFGGPGVGALVQATDVIFNDPFKFVAAFDKDEEFKSTFASRLATFAKQNTPGTSMWYGRLVLERELWDTLDELADPQAYRKQRQRVRKQERDFGNTYWSPPGSGLSGFRG